MSKCMSKDVDFINKIQKWLVSQHWCKSARVYYDADSYSKRDYVADITLYNDTKWDSQDMKYLKEDLRDLGATAILGVKREAMIRTYLDLAFDKKVKG